MPYMFAENDGVSAIAGSKLSKLTMLFDLEGLGLSGQSLLVGHARINLDEDVLANSDNIVNTLLYLAKLTPKLSARAALEMRNSNNSRYDNQFLALALRYDY